MPTSATLDQLLSAISNAGRDRRTVAIVDELTLGEVDKGGGDLRGRVKDAEQAVAEVDGLAQVELVVPGEVIGRQQPAEDCNISSARRNGAHLGS